MEIFGGEKYSKEGYQKAREKQNDAYKAGESIFLQGGQYIALSKICQEFFDISVKASEKAEELYAKGQTEAAALHKEYGRLLAEAQEAIKAVADFEREKLGMHKEGAEEADTDKK